MPMKTRDIIILHGWGLSGGRFSGLKTLLTKKGYRVYAPDLPGFGSSDLPKHPFKLADYALFLKNFIEKNHIQNPAIIGHSFGGRVTLMFDFLYPHILSKIIFTGTPGFTPIAKKKIVFFVLLAKIGKFFFTLPLLRNFYRQVQRWYYYIAGAKEFYRAEGVMRETFKLVVQEGLEEAMKTLHVPTLLVWGADDAITPVWIAEKMHHVIDDSQLVIIPEGDHGVSFKEPSIFVTHIEPFLQH